MRFEEEAEESKRRVRRDDNFTSGNVHKSRLNDALVKFARLHKQTKELGTDASLAIERMDPLPLTGTSC